MVELFYQLKHYTRGDPMASFPKLDGNYCSRAIFKSVITTVKFSLSA